MASKKHGDRQASTLLSDLTVGLFAGLVATQVTNLAQGPLQRMTPGRVEQQEKRVRPGASSSLVAAGKLAERLDCAPSERQVERLGTAVHFGTGIAWGPVYRLMRRHAGLGPLAAALASGAAMSLILDEGVVPALGLSAPNRDYPAFTHIRGALAHLVYGAAAALATEAFGRQLRLPGWRQ